MLTSEQLESFQRDGFLLGSRVLSEAEADLLASEVERVVARRDQGPPQPVMLHDMHSAGSTPIWQIVNIWQVSPPFESLVRNPKVTEEAAQLAGATELRVWHDQIQYKPAGKGGVNMWHQDWPYWPSLSEPAQVTAWLALDDVDEENGCMSMVAGSHLWGDQIEYLHTLKSWEDMPRAWRDKEIRVLPRPVKKGHVHYHHALTWHGSPANKSSRPRRAIGIHYMSEKTLFQPRGFHPMEPHITVARGAKLEGGPFIRVF